MPRHVAPLDMSGQSIIGLATAAAGTNTPQAASTAFVAQAVSVIPDSALSANVARLNAANTFAPATGASLTVRANAGQSATGVTAPTISLRDEANAQTFFVRKDGSMGASTFITTDDATMAISQVGSGTATTAVIPGVNLKDSAHLTFSSTGLWYGLKDAGLSRNAPGVVEVNTGGAGTLAALLAARLRTSTLVVSGFTGIMKANGLGDVAAAVAADFPILNQATTGTAANVTGVVAAANGGTGTAGISGIIKGNGTLAAAAAVAADFPVLNQNTTGTAANITGVLLATSHPAHTGDVTGAVGTTALTLATVNANVGTFSGLTVNGKGLVTAATAIVDPGCVIPMLQEVVAVTSTATTAGTATLIDTTTFLWNAGYLPAGRGLFLEILASATAGSPTVILTALGSTVAVATLVGTASTTTVSTRGAAITAALVSGTTYQARLHNSVAGTASARVIRLIII